MLKLRNLILSPARIKTAQIPFYPILLFFIIFVDKIIFLVSKSAFLRENGFPPSLILSSVIVEDFGILSVVMLLLVFSKRIYLFPFIFLLLLFYFADSQLFQQLFERLTFAKVYEYINEISAIASFISVPKLFAVGVVLLVLWIVRGWSLNVNRRILFFVALAGISLPYINFSGRPFDLFFDGFTSNILKINQRFVVDQRVKGSTLLKARQIYPDLTDKFDKYYSGRLEAGCNNGPGSIRQRADAKPNIIILISESLSQIDSLRSGGVFDRLPRIDKMQSDGYTLTNVVSDGSGTADVMAALLLGIQPLPTTFLKSDVLKRFPPVCKNQIGHGQEKLCERNLICHAKQNGYKTLFLTNSPLSFGNLEPWFKKLGFDFIEGTEADFFRKLPRYTFNSPPDESLYGRAMELISQWSEPYLVVMLTVSLHLPYSLPDERDRISPDAKINQLNYIDRTTYDFYERLKNIGFFSDGVLLIIGDHRRMAPFEPEEIRRRGIDSNGRVVASFIGKGFNKGDIVNTHLNQSDISTILNSMVYGMPLDVDNLRCYNKGYLLGLNEEFTVNLVSRDYIYTLIRRSTKTPYLIQIKSDLDPAAFSDVTEQKIAAYILMSKGWLIDRQKECNDQ